MTAPREEVKTRAVFMGLLEDLLDASHRYNVDRQDRGLIPTLDDVRAARSKVDAAYDAVCAERDAAVAAHVGCGRCGAFDTRTTEQCIRENDHDGPHVLMSELRAAEADAKRKENESFVQRLTSDKAIHSAAKVGYELCSEGGSWDRAPNFVRVQWLKETRAMMIAAIDAALGIDGGTA